VTALIDQLVAKTMQLVGAPVMLIAPGPTVLLMHRAETNHEGTWELPSADDVAPDVDVSTNCSGVLLSRHDAEFKPTPSNKYDDHCWVHMEFAITCTGTHPHAAAAIERFLATHGDSQSGEDRMEDRTQFTAAQAKADAVARLFGDSAPGPLQGERLMDYRVRLVSQYQKHSRTFKDANLARIGDAATLTGVENQIYADTAAALHDPNTFGPDELRPVVTMDAAGRPITRYLGRDGACWDRFNPPIRHVTRIMTPGRA